MEVKVLEDDGKTFIELKGVFYQTFLEQLHSIRRPKAYFEIGTLTGDTPFTLEVSADLSSVWKVKSSLSLLLRADKLRRLPVSRSAQDCQKTAHPEESKGASATL
jgi:hypothetical protein